MPFHFIPGNFGNTLDERLVCQKDSAIVREMVEHHLSISTESFGVELIGITAHVYADTFSHYGFSGISSVQNKVQGHTIKFEVKDQGVFEYIKAKYDAFLTKHVTNGATDFVALGHGAVGTYPDRPFLTWRFTYENNGTTSGERDNQATFMEACENLHKFFSRYAEKMPQLTDSEALKSFDSIKSDVAKILALEGDMQQRISAWQEATHEGVFFKNPTRESIPLYAPQSFIVDEVRISNFDSTTVHSTALFSFLEAAKIHRDYVLNELLPKYNIPIIFRL